ncbi:TPR-like protein [Trichoderma citrinoviride]|uniref:TPR-like protein n=1 Tax=Trichoderma citrinoviride TaxID=58853 RepID=A0A2T4BND0_9HYPO|nr:TPR-like protein [Trichoderma citrinoviride]PTB70791.1 TPR-like protein [Trichoderma citrinoviride]
MLERTAAASLESCNIQRILPKPTRSTKRSRQLHTGFWQHGASAIELASIWPSIGRIPEAEPVENATRPLQAGLVASAFLLDFLYPSATYSLLRRLYPGLPRPQDGGRAGGAARRRHFTSSTAAAEHPSQRSQAYQRDDGAATARESQTSSSNSKAASSDYDSQSSTSLRVDHMSRLQSNAAQLQDMLSHQGEERFHDVWDLYCRLDEQHQLDFRRDMILYLAKSRGIVEVGRAISLFRQIPISSWDDELLAAGVLAFTRSGDLEHAISRLKSGMELKGLVGGLEYVLAEVIANEKWPTLIGVWLEFYASRLKFEPAGRPDAIRLQRLETLPGLDRLFFSFEQYLSSEGRKAIRPINIYETTRLGLKALRRKLAELALAQPCQPRQAAAILEIFNDPQLYEHYFLRVLESWHNKIELTSNVAWLSDLYRTYRKLPGAHPPVSLLQHMFELHYPAGTAALEEIYQDWHRAWGDLDQWGYEKFLKFYAGLGDIQAVQRLWGRYVAKYPAVLRKPRAFRSTMNAYAQVGDVAKAEEELRRMTDHHGVKPDLDIWNTLLKCYMRAQDYNRAVACFNEICGMYRPDSFTYAHIMAMSAKKGDLEATLGFFNRSQKDRIPVSKEMAMSLVMAYCRNDRLLEAERICMELAERGATSTAIWNQLIQFNGMQGKLGKCYELLQAMKLFDLTWDHQTHEFLLQALVRVDQVQPAYLLLQTAYKEKLFPVGPEHFAVVMAGAVRTGELGLVELLASHLLKAGQSMNFNAKVALAEASFRKTPSSDRTRQLGKEFVGHLRSMLAHETSGRDARAVSTLPRDIRHLKKQTKSVGRAIKLLVELRDFKTAEEVMNLYSSIFPKHRGGEPFPPEVISALMLGYFKDRKFRQIHKMWNEMWNRVLVRAKHRKAAGIYPVHEYDVSRPMAVLAKTFREENDGNGLLKCVEQVTSSGFKLTRNNWNLLIRYLAEMGQWEPAMRWCETMLMPRWRGWKPSKRSLQERRHLRNTRVLQASNAAVLSLQHQWLKLRKLAAWSADVSAKLREIERKYPRLHYAFTNTDFENLSSGWDSRRASLRKKAMELLRPFSHAELKRMKRRLERQLRSQRNKRQQRRQLRSSLRAISSVSRRRARGARVPVAKAEKTKPQTSTGNKDEKEE